MSVLKRMLPCPCRTWRCRAFYAARILGTVAAVALIAAQLLIVTNTIHDPISAGKPAPASMAMLMPAIQAARQLQPADTTTTAVVTAAPASWTARTCAAFSTWERHETRANLVTLGIDGLRAPWKYLGGDVWQLVGDEEAVLHDSASQKPGDERYVSLDAKYVREDCRDGSGL